MSDTPAKTAERLRAIAEAAQALDAELNDTFLRADPAVKERLDAMKAHETADLTGIGHEAEQLAREVELQCEVRAI
jgi:hypothetical protein